MQRAQFVASRTIAVGLACSLAIAGCSSGPVAVAPPIAGRTTVHPLARGAGWLSAAAKKCKNRLYVSSYRLGYVAIYCTKGRNQAPIGKITDGIETPEGANVDDKGNLYVTNTSANTVTEYARGSLKRSFTYSAGLTNPAGVAIDRRQNVYVTSLSPASVEVFPQTTNAPSLKITDVPYPIDVAVDAPGNVYVTTYTSGFANGEIIEYSPGSKQGTSLGIVTGAPGGIALDGAGDIVTADQRLPGVLVFPPGQTSPSKTFAQNTLDPDPVRLDRAEHHVYVGDSVGNAVYVYDYPAGTLIDTITDGVDGPNGLALDPAPRL